jgi:tRNA A-37 threonylcarbamoyl transferase component Bud32
VSISNIEDFEALREYLAAKGHADAHESPSFRLLSGGVSNRVVLAVFPDSRQWVLKQALHKLRVPGDWFSSPERIHREAAALLVFENLLGQENIPKLIFDDRDAHVLAMEAVPSPHENWRSLLLAGIVDRNCFENAGKILGTLHQRGASLPAGVRAVFEDQTYFVSLRIEPYYLHTAQVVSQAKDFLAALIRDCSANRITLVHGDFSPKNILVSRGKLVLLDYEVAHWGDPAFDLGFFFALLLSKAHHLPEHRSKLLEGLTSAWEHYLLELRSTFLQRDIEPRAVRHTLGCLLARVEGRSPLDYLCKEERHRQRMLVVSLLARIPTTIRELGLQFIERL